MKVLPVLALLVAGTYATDEDAAIPEEFKTRTHLRAAEVMQIKDDFWRTHEDEIGAAETKLSVRNQKTPCVNGFASVGGERYPCDKVDFLSLIGRAELMRDRKSFNDRTKRMSDIWGWQSPNTGREYTISCMTNVLWFIDSTDALSPRPLAWMESHRAESSWCDTKVYKDTAYVVQDRSASGGNDKGVQVFDLLRLEESDIFNAAEPVLVQPDYTYDRHGAVHNLVIDTDSGFLYSVGTSGGTSCSGGLHMIDLNNDRLKPEFAGCASMDGYIHDAQCVVYEGPDSRYTGKQICFGYNEDTLTVYDVTDKSRPVVLSKTPYGTSRYTHQGWLNKDQDFVMLNDELDEQYGSVSNTRSYIVDVSNLENPVFTGYFDHGVRSIDHNMYFFGDMHARGWGGNPAMRNPPNPDYVYCSNYASGLRIVDTTNIKDTNPSLSLAGYFDVSPSVSGNQFLGVWSAYMHPSGVIALNVIETGVMFVEFEDAFAPVKSVSKDAAPEEVDETVEESTPVNGYAVAFWVTALGFLVAAVAYVAHLRYKSNGTREESAVSQINQRQVAKENLEKSKVGNPMFEVEGQQV